MKKGQITFYILAGVLILAIFGLYFFVQANSVDSEDVSFNPITVHIENCFKKSVESALIHDAYSGFYNYPSNFVVTNFSEIPIFSRGQLLNRDNVLNNLSESILFEFDNCVDLNQFDGFTFETFDKEIEFVAGKELNVKLTYPVKVTKDDVTKAYSSFSYDVKINLDLLIQNVNEFLDKVWTGVIPIEYIADNLDSLKISGYEYGNYSVYEFDDLTSDINKENLRVYMATEVIYDED